MSECRKFDKINNCLLYGSSVLLANTGDKILTNCTKCIDNYYLDNTNTKLTTWTENNIATKYSDACVLRTYLDKNCLKYVLD